MKREYEIQNKIHYISFVRTQIRFDVRERMIFVKSEFFYINRIFLLLLGIWPYQKNKFVYVQRLLSLGILISFVICQVCVSYMQPIVCYLNVHYVFNKRTIFKITNGKYTINCKVFSVVFFIYTYIHEIFFQLLILCTEKYSVNLLFNILSQVFPVMIYVIKYNAFIINSKSVSCILQLYRAHFHSLDFKHVIGQAVIGADRT